MKDKYIIPIFISHKGCPNQCTFCNQKKISGSMGDININKIKDEIEEWLKFLPKGTYYFGRNDTCQNSTCQNSTCQNNTSLLAEIAFFGGSFTGIDKSIQEELLILANEYIKIGKVSSIRISTRPDYIDEDILKMLKKYNVKTIELGVQSMDEEVLLLAKRGHTKEDVERACTLINEFGFELGVQMMIGLRGSTIEKEIATCEELIKLNPKIARIYPVLVIKDTPLEEEYKEGIYKALSVEEAAQRSKQILKLFRENNVEVIRIGLQTTDNINEGKDVVAGPFHPSFGEIVESEIAYDKICEYLNKNNCKDRIKIECNPKDVSIVVGNKRKNLKKIKEKYNVKTKIIQNSKILRREININS